MGPQCQHFTQTSVPEPRLPARTLSVGSRGRVCSRVGPGSRRLRLLMGFWQLCRAPSQARFTGEAEPRRGAGARCRRETLWGRGNWGRRVPGVWPASRGAARGPGARKDAGNPPASHSPTRGPVREAGPRLRGAARAWPGPRGGRAGDPVGAPTRKPCSPALASASCSAWHPPDVQVAHRLLLWPVLTQKHPAKGAWGDASQPCRVDTA